tara:strand:- start:343 stop:837 length:495 start_codon:yes stop_codon:yes gene_type:complete
MILKYWNYILFLISLASILSALIAEYFFNLQPCELCLKQRHPYYFIIGLIIINFLIPISYKTYLFLLIQLSSLYGLFYAIWHVGVENKILKGPSGCSAGLNISTNTIDLKEQILSKQVISCDEIVWSLFGLSAASINTIILLVIFILNANYIYNNYGTKKEENS